MNAKNAAIIAVIMIGAHLGLRLLSMVVNLAFVLPHGHVNFHMVFNYGLSLISTVLLDGGLIIFLVCFRASMNNKTEQN